MSQSGPKNAAKRRESKDLPSVIDELAGALSAIVGDTGKVICHEGNNRAFSEKGSDDGKVCGFVNSQKSFSKSVEEAEECPFPFLNRHKEKIPEDIDWFALDPEIAEIFGEVPRKRVVKQVEKVAEGEKCPFTFLERHNEKIPELIDWFALDPEIAEIFGEVPKKSIIKPVEKVVEEEKCTFPFLERHNKKIPDDIDWFALDPEIAEIFGGIPGKSGLKPVKEVQKEGKESASVCLSEALERREIEEYPNGSDEQREGTGNISIVVKGEESTTKQESMNVCLKEAQEERGIEEYATGLHEQMEDTREITNVVNSEGSTIKHTDVCLREAHEGRRIEKYAPGMDEQKEDTGEIFNVVNGGESTTKQVEWIHEDKEGTKSSSKENQDERNIWKCESELVREEERSEIIIIIDDEEGGIDEVLDKTNEQEGVNEMVKIVHEGDGVHEQMQELHERVNEMPVGGKCKGTNANELMSRKRKFEVVERPERGSTMELRKRERIGQTDIEADKKKGKVESAAKLKKTKHQEGRKTDVKIRGHKNDGTTKLTIRKRKVGTSREVVSKKKKVENTTEERRKWATKKTNFSKSGGATKGSRIQKKAPEKTNITDVLQRMMKFRLSAKNIMEKLAAKKKHRMVLTKSIKMVKVQKNEDEMIPNKKRAKKVIGGIKVKDTANKNQKVKPESKGAKAAMKRKKKMKPDGRDGKVESGKVASKYKKVKVPAKKSAEPGSTKNVVERKEEMKTPKKTDESVASKKDGKIVVAEYKKVRTIAKKSQQTVPESKRAKDATENRKEEVPEKQGGVTSKKRREKEVLECKKEMVLVEANAPHSRESTETGTEKKEKAKTPKQRKGSVTSEKEENKVVPKDGKIKVITMKSQKMVPEDATESRKKKTPKRKKGGAADKNKEKKIAAESKKKKVSEEENAVFATEGTKTGNERKREEIALKRKKESVTSHKEGKILVPEKKKKVLNETDAVTASIGTKIGIERKEKKKALKKIKRIVTAENEERIMVPVNKKRKVSDEQIAASASKGIKIGTKRETDNMVPKNNEKDFLYERVEKMIAQNRKKKVAVKSEGKIRLGGAGEKKLGACIKKRKVAIERKGKKRIIKKKKRILMTMSKGNRVSAKVKKVNLATESIGKMAGIEITSKKGIKRKEQNMDESEQNN